jgi:hypothetical protein
LTTYISHSKIKIKGEGANGLACGKGPSHVQIKGRKATYRIISHDTKPKLKSTKSNIFPAHTIKTLSRVFTIVGQERRAVTAIQKPFALACILISNGSLDAYNDDGLKGSQRNVDYGPA